MKKESALYLVIGLLAGALLMGLTAVLAVNNDNQGMMSMMGMKSMQDVEMSMDEMSADLRTKTGDSFDEAFLNMMIDHHEGAVDMAESALDNAKHEEIKRLANDIIAAQEGEINMMKAWQEDWGYDRSGGHGH